MLRRSYVLAMRLARAWGQRSGWLDYLERRQERPAFLYLRSLFAIHDVEDMIGLDTPWWCFSAIARVEDFLRHRGGTARAFEYGPGASTFWLARRCAYVRFVEHDAAWWDTCRFPIADLENVAGRLVPPHPLEAGEQATHGSGRAGWCDYDFKDYVEAIAEFDGPFDLIVIDGRARSACLAAAVSQLKPDGLVVFDNSNRRRYRKALADCGLRVCRCRGLAPALPYPSETTLLTFAEM